MVAEDPDWCCQLMTFQKVFTNVTSDTLVETYVGPNSMETTKNRVFFFLSHPRVFLMSVVDAFFF